MESFPLLVDLTRIGWNRLVEFSKNKDLPYFRVEPSQVGLVEAAERSILNIQRGHDAAFIFQNEKGTSDCFGGIK